MNEAEAREVFERHGALRTGHFRLSSGLHSDTYAQCALVLQWPGIAERLGHELAARFAQERVDAVVGPAMGGIVIGHEVARHAGVRCVFTERVDGEMTLRRGFALEAGERVLIVEDVVTTGRSPQEAAGVVAAAGAEVVGFACVVDRSAGVSLPARLEAILHITPQTWAQDACPLCAEGVALDTPGSRHLAR